MTKTYKIIGSILAAIALLFGGAIAYGAITAKVKTQDTGYVQTYQFFNNTSTTTVAGLTGATSTNAANINDVGHFVIAGAKRVDVFFQHGGVATTSTGTSTMSIQVSPDGTNWYAFNRLVSSTSTTPAIVPNSTLPAATTTEMYGLDLRTDAFYGLRCVIQYAGASGKAGEQSCKAYAEF